MRKRLVIVLVLAGVVAGVLPASAQVEANWNRPRGHWKGARSYTDATATIVPVINRVYYQNANAETAISQWNAQGTGHLVRMSVVQRVNDPYNCNNVEWHIVLCLNAEGTAYAAGSSFPDNDPTYYGHNHHCRASVDRNWPGVVVWLHEIGHCLGLGHHLHPWGEQNTSVMGGRQSLGPDDWWGIVKLYWHNDDLTPRYPGRRFIEFDAATGTVVDVPYSSTAEGENLILWGRHGGPNQQFAIEPVYPTQYGPLFRLINVNSQHLLKVDPNVVNVEQGSMEIASNEAEQDEWWWIIPLDASGYPGQVVIASYQFGQYLGRRADGSLGLIGSNWAGHTWRITT